MLWDASQNRSALLFFLIALVVSIPTGSTAATFLVTTTSNSGEGSLRAAITAANAAPNEGQSPDRIEFDIPVQPEDLVDDPFASLPFAGPVSRYRAEGNANDSTGDNHGVLTNGATFAPGFMGQAFAFDGVDDTVIVPDSPTLDVTAEFTLSAWLNPSSFTLVTPDPVRDAGILSKVGGPGGNNGYQMGLNRDYTEAFLQFNASGENWPGNRLAVTLPHPLPLRRWSHLVGTYDGESLHLFVNGAPVGSQFVGSKMVVNSVSNLRISGGDNNHAYFPGSIDEAAVYNIALDATEVASLFNAGVGPVRTLRPLSPLPVVTDQVVIDGYTQLGSAKNTNATGALNAKLMVELEGAQAGVSNGLVILAGSSVVRGLNINRFLQQGIYLQTAGGSSVEGCFFGTDVTGMEERPNGFSGIFLDSPNNTIGGTSPESRNLSSGNGFHGVEISGPAASGNRVQGNLIGCDAAGTSSLPGLDSFGVFIEEGPDNVIGGTVLGAGNVISGNRSHGIVIRNSFGNRVEGNIVGADAAGTAALANGARGVDIDGSSDNIIGGTEPGSGNLVSANVRSGVRIRQGSTGNRVEGNRIGTDAHGTGNLGNGNEGVIVVDAADNTIGGTEAGAANTIAYNQGAGVSVDPLSAGQSVLNNSIHSNLGLGIDLIDSGGAGVTPNDPDDADTGANNLQNFPILASVGPGEGKGSNPAVRGSLQSTPATDFRIEVFANSECDPSEHGEGSRFLGSSDVTTDNSGNASIEVFLNQAVSAGEFITATATVIEGPSDFGDTSEFSECLEVTGVCAPPFPDFAVSGRVDGADLLLLWNAIRLEGVEYDLTCDNQVTGEDLLRFALDWYSPHPNKR